MTLSLEARAKRLRELLYKHDVREAMRERCEEQGHDWENCCSATFQLYQACKWCGETKARLT
jgi:hypothetical protein